MYIPASPQSFPQLSFVFNDIPASFVQKKEFFVKVPASFGPSGKPSEPCWQAPSGIGCCHPRHESKPWYASTVAHINRLQQCPTFVKRRNVHAAPGLLWHARRCRAHTARQRALGGV
jgi:hypothetical protein